MTTVGYGDIDHSSSLIVRAGIVLAILAGSFTSSLLTLTFINYIQLTPTEAKAYTSIYVNYLALKSSHQEKQETSKRIPPQYLLSRVLQKPISQHLERDKENRRKTAFN